MITIRAGKAAITLCLLVLAGCSREQQDWRSAEAADTVEAYDQFVQRHPESELATQARTRVAQLGEERDWQRAGSADTVEAYREFVTQHPNGKWTQEARIRIENFSLGEQQGGSRNVGGAGPGAGGAAGSAGAGQAGAGSAAGAAGTARAGAGSAAGTAAASRGGSGAGAGSGAAPGSAGVPGPSTTAAAKAGGLAVPGEAAVPMARAPASAAPRAAGPAGGGSATGGLAAAPAASGPATTASAHSGAYGVQLGAFSSEAAANTEWHLLTGRFGPELQGLSEHVVMAETASGRIYRLQAVVGEEARARAICDSLRKSSQACVAVLPH